MRGPRGGMHVVTSGGRKRYGVKPHFKRHGLNMVRMHPQKKSAVATKYLNSKKRVIFLSARGKFFTVAASGRRVYRVRASHVKTDAGSVRKVTKKHKAVPLALRLFRIFG